MYLKNGTITKTCENKKPIEILLRRKPNINNLRLYGSIVFVRISEFKINSKWHKKADIGILVGYENVGYRILVNNKIIIARHVEFIGKNDNLLRFQGMDESDNETEKDFEEHSDTNEIHESETSDEMCWGYSVYKERKTRG